MCLLWRYFGEGLMTNFNKILLSLFLMLGGIITVLRGLIEISTLNSYVIDSRILVIILGSIMIVLAIVIRLEENGYIKLQKVKNE